MPHGEQLHAVDRSLEYSRPLRGLKLWLAFTVHGADAIRAAIERNLDQATLLASLITADPRFELLVEPQLSAVCFRHLPPAGDRPRRAQRWPSRARSPPTDGSCSRRPRSTAPPRCARASSTTAPPRTTCARSSRSSPTSRATHDATRSRSRASPSPSTTTSTAAASPARRRSRSAARSTGTTGSSPRSRTAARPRSTRRCRRPQARSRPGRASDPTAGTSTSRDSPTRSTPPSPTWPRSSTADNGSLYEAMSLRVLPRAANNIRFFADFARDRLNDERTPHAPRRRAQPRPLRPGRRRRRLDAVERAVHARDLAGRAGARGRRHGRAEAARVGAAHLLAARRPRRPGRPPAGRAQRRPRHGRRRRARRSPGTRTSTGSRSPGSPATAHTVYRDAAANLTPVSFELGGKSPFIVFEDADLDAAAATAAYQYDNSGQVCLAGTRLLVQRDDPRRLPRALRSARRRDPRRRPARPGHDVRPADPPGRARARHRLRRARVRSRREPRVRRTADRRPVLPADAVHRRPARRRDPAPTRCSARCSRCRRSTTRPRRSQLANGTDYGLAATDLHGLAGPRRPGQRRGRRRHGVGQLLLRARPRDAVRRRRAIRASAARAATTRSTSTPTSRRSSSGPRCSQPPNDRDQLRGTAAPPPTPSRCTARA